ncbi:heterokaryon incompatibility protein-domain-containing protein [Lasiosphaeria hispida]|uniref:Heterokaryon incompatibility protein-domain-containing protein n=1 Tax=Lasiosphaeria hispida TaxID=260671 RepID=A0AAJ0HWC0_9PEZI|nr:heterokaryon incompatibility protein-domain-containing protein [Lasiosphaeria hispida]
MQSSMQAQIKQIFDSLAIFDGRDQQPRSTIQLARFRELCSHCKLPKGHPWSTYRAPIRSRLQTWLSGALSECINCSVIIAGVHVLSMFEPCKSDDLISAESSLTPGLMTLRNYSHSYPNFNLVLYGQEVIGLDTQMLSPGYWSGISSRSDSPSCTDLAKKWLSDCIETHIDCRLPTTPPELPTRILDLGSPTLRLRITNGECGQYAALSHCWGPIQPDGSRTLLANIDVYKERIAYEALPKTFQDAIQVSRALGYKFLWIDSLCIIQDDQADWVRESSSMALVYGKAHLVIAASSSSGCTEGFLKERPGQIDGTFASPVLDERQTRSIVRYHPGRGERILLDEPLDRRAWTFQEILLARRLLLFGTDMLRWECETSHECECSLDHPRYTLDYPRNLRKLKKNLGFGIAGWWDWHNVVYQYTRRKLSKDSDKLVALSAVSLLYGDALGAHYLAGLWRENLIEDLLWETEAPCRPAPSGAPSWSWASLDGQITWTSGEPLKITSQVHAEVTHSTIDEFGSVKEGWARIKGHILDCKLVFVDADVELCLPDRYTFDGGICCESSLRLDSHVIPVEIVMSGGITQLTARRHWLGADADLVREYGGMLVWCLCLGTRGYGTKYKAETLVLGRCSQNPMLYERLGVATLSYCRSDCTHRKQQPHDWIIREITVV